MNASLHPVNPEEVMALLDGELAAERSKSVSAHVETCAACQKIATNLGSTSQSLANWLACAPRKLNVEDLLLEKARKAADTNGGGLYSNLRRVFGLRPAYAWATAAVGVLGMVMIVLTAGRPYLLHTSVSPAFMAVRGAQVDRPVDRARTNVDSRFDKYSDGVMGGAIGGLREEAAESQELKQEQSYRSWVQNGPMIARTVSLAIVAKDFSSSRAGLDAILSRHHGYAASLAVNTEQNAARSLRASLRVPAAEFSAVLAELKSLGRVQNERQNGEEVTQQHADLVARLKNSRETEARLQDILQNRTGKISDVLAVEQEIARVRGEIEQMEAERSNLENRVEFASVDLNLSEEYKAQLETPAPSISTRLHNAVVSGLRSALETVVSIALFSAEVGPSLLIWMVVFLPFGWFLWRRWRRSYGLATSG